MKRFITSLAALGLLAAAVPAFADTDTTVEKSEKSEVHGKKAKHTRSEKKKVDPDGMGNSTTDTAKTDTDKKMNDDGTSTTTTTEESKHDAPGTKHDHKAKVKKTTTKDADGNVIDQKTETK